MLADGPYSDEVRQLDRMRLARNRSEYDAWLIRSDEARADLGRAQAILAAVEAAWPA